ncbi:MAG: hypothetical protein P9M14_01185 [Candidatus Alcyoniella australis]|nr:hypothetical protein [Candidatus Alcyoniella australis]
MRGAHAVPALVVLAAIILTAAPVAAELSDIELGGYLMSHIGVFIEEHPNREGPEGFPVDHGEDFGDLSAFRNTLFLQLDWRPHNNVWLHSEFRGVRSASLDADNYAQVPVFWADETYNDDQAVKRDKRRWVQENYYTENDLREIWVDFDAFSWLNFRVGRQQVSWGETGSYRTLDVVNPTDSTWHLSVFEDYKDQRIPLWILKTLVDVQPLRGNLEIVWVPMIDDPEDTATVPLTFVGAWGLPIACQNDTNSTIAIEEKVFLYPDNDLKDSRIGARWKGVLGNLTYTMVYYYTHQLSPPVPKYAEIGNEVDSKGRNIAKVYLDFPREMIAGMSLEFPFPRPISTVLRMEAAYEFEKAYPVSSYLGPGADPRSGAGRGWYPSPENEGLLRADFYSEKRDTISYAVVLQRPSMIRWINPTSSIIVQAQFMQTIIPEDVYIEETFEDGSSQTNENWYLVSIPGYDSSKPSMFSSTVVLALLTNYFHGMYSPMVVAAYVPGKEKDGFTGFVSVRNKFAFGNHWRLEIGYNGIFAPDPYKSLGLFADRDEAYAKVKFQF